MSNYLSEAFKKLEILDEDVFDLDKDGLTALKDFEDKDEEDDSIAVIDPDAESEEDLEDSYIGKVILDCSVCHTDIYKDKEDITIDEEAGLANIGEECPYCYSSEGFKVIGEVKPFVETTFETDDDVEVEVENESLKRKRLKEDYNTRKYSDMLYDMIENDEVDAKKVAEELIYLVPEGIIAERMRDYELIDDQDDEDEDYDESLHEDTVKQGKYWVNKGDEGTHGKFRTKKAADEQRKAMFAGGFKAESLKESCSIDQCQKWVDYDMKKYKKISDDTMEKIKSSGYSVVKDQYGDYEVIADRKDEACHGKKSRKMKESIEDITIDTGDQEISVSARDKEKKSDGEMIAPLSDEVKADIEMDSDDVDVDVDEFSEEDFDELGESYLKKVYENVDSYRTTSVNTKGNKLFVEGLIKFNSGKEKKTSFVFESRTITKSGKAKLIGENLQISRGHKSFKLTGTINNGKFISESLNYNYRVKNGSESQRVYGTAKKSK